MTLATCLVGRNRAVPDGKASAGGQGDGRLWHKAAFEGVGRACPLCPGSSDIDLFGNRECVVDLDPEIPDRALDLRMAEQELNST